MSTSGIFLDYHGTLDISVLNSLLNKLKNNKEYKMLNKTTSKRVYSLVVECLENICKHSDPDLLRKPGLASFVTVRSQNDNLVISAGNPITGSARVNIENRIIQVNNSDESSLRKSYENIINGDLSGNDKCAGLGFIQMALLTGNKINWSFNPLSNGYLLFEIQLTLKKSIMRKLIIEQRSNSPKVILDPDKGIYSISGESRPPDVREFYEPVLEWLNEFSKNLQNSKDNHQAVIFNFNFEYFNSSSGKSILDICKILTVLSSHGSNIRINWQTEKDDFDMLEAGKEISRIVKFPFEFSEGAS